MARHKLSLHAAAVQWTPLPAFGHIAARAGFEAVVVSRDQPFDIDISDVPVPATAMLLTAEVRRDEDTFLRTFERLRGVANLASRLGAKTASCAIPSSAELPRAEQASLLTRRLRACCDVLAEFGITLGVECLTPLHLRNAHPYPFLWRNAEMLDFVRTIAPNTGLIVDSWHWHHGGSDPQEILGVPAESIVDVHISDSPNLPPAQIRDMQRALPGTGVIDFATFFSLLTEKGYAGPVTAEGFIPALDGLTPDQAAEVCFRHARNVTP